MKTEANEYQKQATDFLTKTGCEISIEYLKHGKHFEDDKEERDIYKITLKRGSRAYAFNFGQSLNNSGVKVINKNTNKETHVFKREDVTFTNGKINYLALRDRMRYPIGGFEKIVLPTAPTPYDVLACLTKYDPGTFENFCADFGYDEDSRKAERIYKAVKKEFTSLYTLFNDEELNELSEIQ